jgi:hypothetical protein
VFDVCIGGSNPDGDCSVNGDLDCPGLPNGSANFDNCETCVDGNTGLIACEPDCAGLWGGPDNQANTGDEAVDETVYLDVDGDGLGAGSAYFLCDGSNLTGWVINDFDTDDNCTSNFHDCAGLCDGTSVVDECGVCGGDNSTCVDCAGTPNGSSYKDECNVCKNCHWVCPHNLHKCCCHPHKHHIHRLQKFHHKDPHSHGSWKYNYHLYQNRLLPIQLDLNHHIKSMRYLRLDHHHQHLNRQSHLRLHLQYSLGYLVHPTNQHNPVHMLLTRYYHPHMFHNYQN